MAQEQFWLSPRARGPLEMAMEGGGLRARGAADGGKPEDSRSKLSVIVPTYNETENIRPLCERLFKTVKAKGLETELLIVDDESAGSAETEKIAKQLASEGYQVRIHCRKRSEGRGLSSAVLLGFKLAIHPIVLCMDADLQHEPESVPDVARPVLEGLAEFSVGSRHVAGGGVGFEWSVLRQLVSRGATMLAWPVAACSDPMSGFFCVSKEVLQRGEGRLNLIGFKVGLEVMVRCRCKPIQDVAITFQERAAGESKLSAKQYKLYLEQLAGLYWEKYGMLLVLFLILVVVVLAYVMRLMAQMLL
uniref:Dolichol-phosphate mannosyltransferase subunit 1 n=1 Tax=Alexandrium catenella TaxID=2925 RepID=A0A7S1LIQ9_ALECA